MVTFFTLSILIIFLTYYLQSEEESYFISGGSQYVHVSEGTLLKITYNKLGHVSSAYYYDDYNLIWSNLHTFRYREDYPITSIRIHYNLKYIINKDKINTIIKRKTIARELEL